MFLYFLGGPLIVIIITFIFILIKEKFKIIENEGVIMEKTTKRKLLYYLLISAVSFSYLILPKNAGISVPIFVLIQFVFLYLLAPKKKPLLMFIPIFILALNSFISASEIWRVSNFFVTIVLYSVMTLWMAGKFSIPDIIKNIFTPIANFIIPIKWGAEANKENVKTAQRILIGVVISVPCLAFLLLLLSSADAIFANILGDFVKLIDINILLKIVIGIIAGFYLFGMVYSVYQPKMERIYVKRQINGDLIILNILLTSILAVYTIFVVIQFKYLFANGNELPYGLTYTYYARRGFFELLFLTGLNILLILITINLTKTQKAKFTKILCCYLCAVTIILLVSSFYRMWLYNTDDGLTRLRFLVFGFLIFEAIGLIFTFVFIFKPKLNIIAVYACIGLTYYLLLNVVPMDAIIAKDQIDRYFENGAGGIDYTLTLSPDAANQIARLRECDDSAIKEMVREYFNNGDSLPTWWQWQQWNFSRVNYLKPTSYSPE